MVLCPENFMAEGREKINQMKWSFSTTHHPSDSGPVVSNKEEMN